MYTDNWKNGVTLTVKERQTTRDGGEKTVTEVAVHENIPAYIIKMDWKTFSKELGEMTDKDQVVLKVSWKKTGIQKRMKAYLTDKDSWLIGAYNIFEVEPKRIRGRLTGFYLYLDRNNEG